MMMKQSFNRRHSPNRRKTQVKAILHLDDQKMHGCIVDVSYTGMRISVPENIPIGTPVMIEMLDVKVPAIVHWSKTRFAGVHLLERLEGETLRALENAHDLLAAYR